MLDESRNGFLSVATPDVASFKLTWAEPQARVYNLTPFD